MKNGIGIVLLIAVLAGGITYGLIAYLDAQPRPGYPGQYKSQYNYAGSEFKDDAQTNFQVQPDKFPLTFLDREGKPLDLKELLGRRPVVVVFMRGITKDPGGICPSCSTQTSRLATNYNEFSKRGCEVLVVYPGSRKEGEQFTAHIEGLNPTQKLPFAIALDEDYQAVDRLGIRGDAAKPSTFLFDRTGAIKFAYVGETTTDRPSLKAIYRQLDALKAEAP